jgi:hypothetical protein
MIQIIRNILKKYFPKFYKSSEKLRLVLYKKVFTKKKRINLVDEFFEFSPGGSGKSNLINENIIFNIKNISKTLMLLIKHTKKVKDYKMLDIDEDMAKDLKDAFQQNGSDKYIHDYHFLYSYIFSNFKIKKLVEIGLGSIDKNILSNMGNFGKPGGCLRAFSEILEDDAVIIGLEIDEKALFNEKNIKTYKFDQLNINDINKFVSNNPEGFDLVIDDGLHSNISFINTIYMSQKILNKNGLIVIEDIFAEQLDFLIIAFNLCKEIFDYEIYLMNKEYVLIANKKI